MMEYTLSVGTWMWFVGPPVLLLLLTLYFFIKDKEVFK